VTGDASSSADLAEPRQVGRAATDVRSLEPRGDDWLELKRGRCHIATVHDAACAARSSASHFSWVEVALQPPTCERLL